MFSENTIVVLERTKEILSKPSMFTKKALARNSVGEHVRPASESAVCWCLHGALEKAAIDSDGYWGAASCVMLVLGGYGIASFNDNETTSYNDVINVLDKSISMVREICNLRK